MILPNGYIETETTTGGGIDADGHAVACVTSYADKTYCQFVKSENLQQRVDGEAVTSRTYDIYIDAKAAGFSAERIRLSDKNGVVLGVYAVRSIEMLDAVGQCKLTV